MRPSKLAYGEYYATYIGLVKEDNVRKALINSITRSEEFWNSLTEEQGNFRYAENKWSIKEVLQHIIDTERIFSYRALAFARGETSAIPGYNENEYADTSLADERKLSDLVRELSIVRQSTLLLFGSFSSENLDKIGNASNAPLSARAAGFIIVGHEIHHTNVVSERYLV
ncbi:MAG: putative damage-inducible protein DinB [Bacteroidia bacterium]|jgi:uncharacterized damage-inducible protein DinB